MQKVIVILRSPPSESIDFPDEKVVRSCFGALRLFSGIPKSITLGELEVIKKRYKKVYTRLEIRPYIESKRVDHRGISEQDLNRLIELEGISHLKTKKALDVLRKKGKIPTVNQEKPQLDLKKNLRGSKTSEK